MLEENLETLTFHGGAGAVESELPAAGGVDVDDAPLGVHHQDHVPRDFEDPPVLSLREGQRLRSLQHDAFQVLVQVQELRVGLLECLLIRRDLLVDSPDPLEKRVTEATKTNMKVLTAPLKGRMARPGLRVTRQQEGLLENVAGGARDGEPR